MCMQPNVNLPDGLADAAKGIACEQNLTSYGRRGSKPLIDIDDSDALWPVFDSPDPA